VSVYRPNHGDGNVLTGSPTEHEALARILRLVRLTYLNTQRLAKRQLAIMEHLGLAVKDDENDGQENCQASSG
jgi:hypothetical protein